MKNETEALHRAPEASSARSYPADHLVYEGIKPGDLEPGDMILKVDKRPDGTLCCLTVFRKAEQA